MVKIWGKIIVKEKIAKHKTIEVDETTCSFFDMLRTLCNELNVPTPVLLDKHVHDFNLFKICIFKPDDFIEDVKFHSLTLEFVKEI